VKLAVLNIRQEPYYRRNAFEQGLKRLGYTLIPQPPARPELSRDSLLISWNLKRGAEEEAARDWERRGGTAIVVENGYLQKIDKSRYAISTHGHNGSGWFPVGDEDRFTSLGFALKPWHEKGTEILVRGQRGIGSSIMASPPQWGEKMTEKLRARGAKVRFIPHPGNLAPRVPEDEDLKNAKELHIWCSAMGVRALVEGVPVKHHAPYWVCGLACAMGAREAALHEMSHGQWHFEEIATGEPFARMAVKDWGPRWP
jgi:hypothetical protein